MGYFLEVQRWDSALLLPRAQVQSLVGELRSHKPHGVVKNKKIPDEQIISYLK